MKGKAFEDAELRANAAGTCGLAALTCAESSRAHASRIHATCKALPPLPNASQEELDALCAWRDDIRQEVTAWIVSDVGDKLSVGIFNKETETIHQQLAKFAKLAPTRTILLYSGPSQMHLFSDDKRIANSMEAADKQWPYAPKQKLWFQTQGRG
jgi:hypothetical protein